MPQIQRSRRECLKKSIMDEVFRPHHVLLVTARATETFHGLQVEIVVIAVQVAEATHWAMIDRPKKMPEPIIEPTTSAVASNSRK